MEMERTRLAMSPIAPPAAEAASESSADEISPLAEDLDENAPRDEAFTREARGSATNSIDSSVVPRHKWAIPAESLPSYGKVLLVTELTQGYKALLLKCRPLQEAYNREHITSVSRCRIGGAIWVTLQFLLKLQRLELTDGEFEELLQSSHILSQLAEAVPLVLLTVQALAETPSMELVLRTWAAETPMLGGDLELINHGLPKRLKPWQEPHFWTFDCWSVARSVVDQFLTGKQEVHEEHFLDTLQQEAYIHGDQKWKVPLIVATLYIIRHSPWVWSLLM